MNPTVVPVVWGKNKETSGRAHSFRKESLKKANLISKVSPGIPMQRLMNTSRRSITVLKIGRIVEYKNILFLKNRTGTASF